MYRHPHQTKRITDIVKRHKHICYAALLLDKKNKTKTNLLNGYVFGGKSLLQTTNMPHNGLCECLTLM
jgi:hypothetical protein